MAYKVSTKEHLAFLKSQVNNPITVAEYNQCLLDAHFANERRHCLASTVVKHYSRTIQGVCAYCGGNE